MQSVKVIPCLDMSGGRVVKGVRFTNLVDAGDPVEVAKAYSAAGADEIAFLDINATTQNRGMTLDILSQVSKNVSVPIIAGGGVRSVQDIEAVMATGASKVLINTAALRNPQLIEEGAKRFGKCIVVAIDVKSVNGKYYAFANGGRENVGIDAVDWAVQAEELGAAELLPTSLDADGTQAGFDLVITRAIADAVSIPVTASGGAGTLNHFLLAVTQGHASAVLAASLFHFGKLTIPQVKAYLSEHDIEVCM